MRKLAILTAAAILVTGTSATAAVTTTSTINGSTSGYLVTGPTDNLCTGSGLICYASPNGTVSSTNPGTAGASPLIARLDAADNTAGFTADVSSLFTSTVTGSEFTLSYNAGTNQLTFNYNPGAGDPVIHYLGISQASNYYLFYDTTGITSATINLSDLFPNNPGWSHVDVYDTGAVPEPATWAMMLLGFAGIGFTMRRRTKAGLKQLA